MNADDGTYAVVLRADAVQAISVGSLGEFRLNPGYFIYVGSAFGPGGVQARVNRHHRRRKRRHWHIDYLTEHLTAVGVWYTHDSHRREHAWAGVMTKIAIEPAIEGFGCSDCGCYTHLFYTASRPSLSSFRRAIAREIADHQRILARTPWFTPDG